MADQRLSKTDIETIRRWIVGGVPDTRGDPHVKTVDGTDYDFQAAGEFVLLRGQNLEIQARQTPVETESALGPNGHTGLTSCVSVNTAVALKVGATRITYQPGERGPQKRSALELRIDGKLVTLGAGPLPLASGGRIARTSADNGIRVDAPGGTSVVITPGFWDYYRIWYMNVDTSHARATDGVMGSIAPGNWLPALPDGSLLGSRPTSLVQRYQDLYGKFGKAWRVKDSTSLFDYAAGTSTATFTLESWPNGESPRSCRLPGPGPRRAPAKTLALEVAKEVCRPVLAPDARANCVQDVRVTGDRGFAKTYLQAERIAGHKPPAVPILGQPANFATAAAGPPELSWSPPAQQHGENAKLSALCLGD